MPLAHADSNPPFPLSDRWEGRAVWIDVMRAVAILLVACGHMAAAFALPTDVPTVGRGFWFALIQLAVAGVDIFLVLSGFLVGGALLSELRDTGRIDVARFYVRRILRLWPSYLLAVLFAWKWNWIATKLGAPPTVDGQRLAAPSLTDMWPFFFQVQNYYDLHAHQRLNIGAVMQTWTLALIVQFYVIAPVIVLALNLLSGKRLRAMPYLVAIALVACLAMRWRAAPKVAADYDAWRNYFPTHLRIDEILVGMLGAWWVVYHPGRVVPFVRKAWPVLVLVGVAAFVPVGMRKEEGPPWLVTWGYTLAGVGCVPLVLVGWTFSRPGDARHFTPRATPLIVRLFSAIGLWSYSIYLWHQPTGQVLGRKVRDVLFRKMVGRGMDPWHSPYQYWMSAGVYFVVALGLGIAAYYVIERPSLILRDRLLGRRDQPTTPAAAGDSPMGAPPTKPVPT